MKRIVLFTSIVLLLITTSFSYDTKGKFGMGIRMWGTPLLLFSCMKIGVNNFLTIEPSVGFNQFKLTDDTEVEVYDPLTGLYSYKDVTLKQKYNTYIFSALFDMKPVRKDKSNFIVKAGLGYWCAKSFDDYYNSSSDQVDTFEDIIWVGSVLGGLGVEHFFTDHFCVYAGFLAGWGIFGSDYSYYDMATATSVGNQFAELSLIWYLK